MRLTIVIALFLFFCNSYAQMPEWVNVTPVGYVNDYFIGRGASKSTRVESVNLALEDAIVAIIRKGNITVKYSEIDSISSEQTDKNYSSDVAIVRKTIRELNVSGSSRTIKGLKQIESYSEFNKGIYESWVLISIPKTHPISPPTTFENVWRSTLIPGWGQLHRGDKFKGFTFLTLTAGTLISGIILNKLSSDANRDANVSKTQARRDFYNDRANTYNTFSTISFIAATALYAWNLTDAIVIKKENLYVDIYPSINNLSINFTFNF